MCDHEVMAKEKTTLYLDEDVLRQTEAAAAGSGRDESELVEDALRRYSDSRSSRACGPEMPRTPSIQTRPLLSRTPS